MKGKKSRITTREFDYLLDRKMKASDQGQQYKHAISDFQARHAIQAGSMARNYQIQYGNLLESSIAYQYLSEDRQWNV